MSVAETRNDSVAGTAHRAPPDVAESSDVTMRPSSLDDTSTVTTTHTHTHTHPFNGPLSGSTQVSRYQKGKNQSGFYWSERQ